MRTYCGEPFLFLSAKACKLQVDFINRVTMKFNPATLQKIEKIITESGYVLRYERGTFQSGYCILQEKKVVVLNKFLQTEGRINTLIDLIPQLNINFDALTYESQKLLDEITASQPVK
jgi:hypothetical protein